jgi:hypothetical protein
MFESVVKSLKGLILCGSDSVIDSSKAEVKSEGRSYKNIELDKESDNGKNTPQKMLENERKYFFNFELDSAGMNDGQFEGKPHAKMMERNLALLNNFAFDNPQYEESIAKIEKIYKDALENEKKGFEGLTSDQLYHKALDLRDKIKNMQPGGDPILILGGYIDYVNGEGHSMAYEFKRNQDGTYQMKIINRAPGLFTHHHFQGGFLGSFRAKAKVEDYIINNIKIENIEKGFIIDLLSPYSVKETNKQRAEKTLVEKIKHFFNWKVFDPANQIYRSVEKHLLKDGAFRDRQQEKLNAHSMQRAGTCSARGITALNKEYLGEDIARKFKVYTLQKNLKLLMEAEAKAKASKNSNEDPKQVRTISLASRIKNFFFKPQTGEDLIAEGEEVLKRRKAKLNPSAPK